jgi:type III pantothenate kinase
MSWRLYIDFGNSSLKFAARRSGAWLVSGRVPLDPMGETEPAVPSCQPMLAALQEAGLSPTDCERLVYCSSNSGEEALLHEALALFTCPALRLGRDLQAELPSAYLDPSQLGADRLANAVAARELHGTSVVVLDVGSCLTTEVIDSEGTLLGGAIAAGQGAILAGLLALTPHLLDAIEAQPFPGELTLLGRSTGECLVLGLQAQIAGTANALVTLARQALGDPVATVVLTGGDAALVAQQLFGPFVYHEFLTLDGLRLIDDYE